jgi:hypothetical protein
MVVKRQILVKINMLTFDWGYKQSGLQEICVLIIVSEIKLAFGVFADPRCDASKVIGSFVEIPVV